MAPIFTNRTPFDRMFLSCHIRVWEWIHTRSRREIWRWSDCNWTQTQNHLVLKKTLNHLAKGPLFLKNHEMNPVKSWNMKKNSWPCGLGPRNYIWATWVQKMYSAISPEPWLQFSQTGLHFLQNHNMNPMKLWNFKKFHELGVWGLKTSSGHVGPKRCIKP